MLKCMVVDDEDYARNGLISLLKEFEDIEIVGEASNGFEAISMLKRLDPDLIFLDIRMPKMSGIEVANILMKENRNIIIVFVTAYDEFAIRAFEVNALGYILKPVSKIKLEQLIDRVKKLNILENKEYVENIESVVKKLRKSERYNDKRIFINERERISVLDISSIKYIKSYDGFSHVFSTKGIFKSRTTLNDMEEQLNYPNFFRSHRSYLINIDFIDSMIPWFNGTYVVELSGIKEQIPISRSKINDFKNVMNV